MRTRPSGAAAITTYIISKTTSLSDLLEVYVLLKEAGLYRISMQTTAGRSTDHGRAAVRNHRRP
jgi:phosphoenolpyruvate carboxylase